MADLFTVSRLNWCERTVAYWRMRSATQQNDARAAGAVIEQTDKLWLAIVFTITVDVRGDTFAMSGLVVALLESVISFHRKCTSQFCARASRVMSVAFHDSPELLASRIDCKIIILRIEDDSGFPL